MHAKVVLGVGCLALSVLGWLDLQDRAGRVLDNGYHHLGNDATKDWPEASELPEGKRLDVNFESKSNAGDWTLFLEQRSIDNIWRVELNGVEFALLKTGAGLVEKNYVIPSGRVRDGANVLSFVPDEPNDDVVIGKLRLVEMTLRQMYDTQPVSLVVFDEQDGSPIPARVTIVDAAGLPVEMYYAESLRSAVRNGVIYVSDAAASLELPPGEYTSYATRGFEWSVSKKSFVVVSGAPSKLEHSLRREVDTTGFLAADTHMHTLQFSGHGDASALERQITLAGEGVELAIATDHNHNIDYTPFQAQTGLTRFFTTVVGNEVTTEVGHFNGFPLDAKAEVPNYKARDFVAIVDGIRAKGAKVVILNHPRWPSYEDSPFTNEKLDHATGTFASGMQLTVDATELINATTEQADPLRLFSDWFALLSRGLRIFAVGTSDSHTVGDPVGQGRTYFVSDSDDPANIDIDKACAAIKNGHSSIGMGIFVGIVVNDTARMGDTLAIPPAAAGITSVDVKLRVQAPSWIVPRKLSVFVNGSLVLQQDIDAQLGKATDRLLRFDLQCPDNYDRWLVCVVTGDSAQGPFWPSLNPYSLAATNPVFLDCDGGGFSSPRETAELEYKLAAGSVSALGSAFGRIDETIAVHLLDIYAQELRAAKTPEPELRRLVLKLVSRTNPAYKQLRSFADRF